MSQDWSSAAVVTGALGVDTLGDILIIIGMQGVHWLSGRVLDSRLKGRGFESRQRHCIVSLSKTH